MSPPGEALGYRELNRLIEEDLIHDVLMGSSGWALLRLRFHRRDPPLWQLCAAQEMPLQSSEGEHREHYRC